MGFWDRFRQKLPPINDRPAFVKIVTSADIYDDYICGILKIPEDIIKFYRKEGNMTNEYIEGFAQRKAELEAEKFALENADIEAVVNAKFEEIKDGIRADILKVHYAEIEDKEVEIKAIDRLIAKEVAKLEAQVGVAEPDETAGQDNVEA